jgi:hypothetical protein
LRARALLADELKALAESAKYLRGLIPALIQLESGRRIQSLSQIVEIVRPHAHRLGKDGELSPAALHAADQFFVEKAAAERPLLSRPRLKEKVGNENANLVRPLHAHGDIGEAWQLPLHPRTDSRLAYRLW